MHSDPPPPAQIDVRAKTGSSNCEIRVSEHAAFFTEYGSVCPDLRDGFVSKPDSANFVSGVCRKSWNVAVKLAGIMPHCRPPYCPKSAIAIHRRFEVAGR